MEWAAERTPRPKSPPENAGLYGKSRHSAKLVLLEKEITSLQEELKSLDCLQPSSRCCQEVNEFVVSRVDPLLATNQNHHKSSCCWTRNWGKPCLRTKWNCCCCFDENNSSRRSKKSSRRQPGSNTRHCHQGGCCCCSCQLDSLCCANGNRKCCGLSSVSCSKPSCCCSGCGSGSCCSLKPWCNGRAKCCLRCTDLSNCCSCC